MYSEYRSDRQALTAVVIMCFSLAPDEFEESLGRFTAKNSQDMESLPQPPQMRRLVKKKPRDPSEDEKKEDDPVIKFSNTVPYCASVLLVGLKKDLPDAVDVSEGSPGRAKVRRPPSSCSWCQSRPPATVHCS
jgi:hypothetical protein